MTTHSFVFHHKLVKLQLLPVLVEELFALVRRLVGQLVRHQRPVPAAQTEARFQQLDFVVRPECVWPLGLDEVEAGTAANELSNLASHLGEASRTTLLGTVRNF